MILLIGGVFKILVGLIGVITTLVFLILLLFKKYRKGKLQYAGITLFSTVLLIVVITIIEFFIYPENPKLDQLILTAYREAPIGGYWLGLYDDSTWELGNSSREIEMFGDYSIKKDTLYLNTANGESFYNGEVKNIFLIGKNNLIELKNTGIKGLSITMSKLG